MSEKRTPPETLAEATRFAGGRKSSPADRTEDGRAPKAAPRAADLIGTQIGHYRIDQRIGKGGMGLVFQAHDLRLERTVALKFLLMELSHDPHAKSRFLREARSASRLDHPNICTIHEIGETDDGRMFIVMAYYQGESLRARLGRGPLPIDEAVRIFRQVADGLACAHRAGIVHRDVKPANVFLLPGGQVKVLDFGIAKVVDGDALTRSGLGFIGTPGYMAPEQAVGEADHRADIWALGVLLFEMLTGTKPFRGSNMVRAVLRDPTPSVRAARPETPPFLETVIERALEKQPDRRFQSVVELTTLLPMADDPATVSETAMASGTWGPGLPAPPPPRRRGWVLAAIVALAVAVGLWVQRDTTTTTAAGTTTEATPGTPSPSPQLQRPVLAVLPFTVRGTEPFAYLGEGMVDLLSTKLDGAGDLRAVDPRTLLRQLQGRTIDTADPAAARALASELGANSAILGTVVEVAGQLRLDAQLYRFGPPATEAVLRASTEGPATEIFELVDGLATQLLAGMSQGAGARIRRLATATSESFAAVKAYLEAERALRAGSYQKSIDGFEVAVAEDPDFALAWYRLSGARRMLFDLRGSAAALERAIALADRLAPDDRKLIEAFQALTRSDAATAERLSREILARRPDDLEAWTVLAEVEFHLGPFYGSSASNARQSWERVLELAPEHFDAALHLARLDLYEGRLQEAGDSLRDMLVTLEGTDKDSEPIMLLAILPTASEMDLDRLRRRLLGSELGVPWLSGGLLLSGNRHAVDTWASFYQLLLASGRSPRERAFGFRHLGIFSLTTGELEEAGRYFRSAEQANGNEVAYRALAATVPFLPVSETDLAAVTSDVQSWSSAADVDFSLLTPHAPIVGHVQHYLLGLLASRRGDAERALTLADALQGLGEIETAPGLVHDLAAGVRADVAFQGGRYAEVLGHLERFEGRLEFGMMLISPFFSMGRERYLIAESLYRLGRDEEAARWFAALDELHTFDLVYLGIAQQRQAAIHDRLGDPVRATHHLERFVDQWATADPALRPLVDEAKRKLGR